MLHSAFMVGILSGARQGHILQQLDRIADGIDVVDVLQRIRDDLHPGQLAFVDDQSTSILGVSAGYGAGKTRALCAKAVHLAMANQGFIGVVMEPTGPLIRDIWQSDFDDFLEAYDIPYTFRASPLPEYTLHLPDGDSKILCRSFENWQRIIGINGAWILADEIDTVNPAIANKAFPKILGRLRSGNVRQFAAASTPEGFRWMWQTFASDDGKTREDRRLIRMRTQDNPHLPPDFIERMQANYDPQLLKAYLDGEFVNLTTGQVYDRFDRVKHVTTQVLDVSREPLRIGVDFNVGNMSAVIAIRVGKSLHVVDEVSGAHDTDALAQKIKTSYPDHKIYIYPDASGGNRSTNATQTDIAILEGYGMSNQSPRANPPVRDRVAAVQALLENGKGEIRLKIAGSCVKTIEGLELQSYTEKGDPDKDAGYDHMNDALGYLVWREFNPLHAGAGRGTGIRLY
jgi:PBSX family phage terminase large subunit